MKVKLGSELSGQSTVAVPVVPLGFVGSNCRHGERRYDWSTEVQTA